MFIKKQQQQLRSLLMFYKGYEEDKRAGFRRFSVRVKD